jgi:hypothetical protein
LLQFHPQKRCEFIEYLWNAKNAFVKLFCKDSARSPDVKNLEVAFFLYFGEGIGGALLVNGSIVRS